MQKEHPDDYQGLIQKRMEALVEDVNKELHSYQKITRVTVTYKPLPLTTTAKVKRFEIKELFAD
jgi:long-chain acyl-CoA synthetase